ncbi:MAG: BolA family protein [Spiribacter sp.]|nr:BolA family protein [Spiribacter sp.]
MSEIPAASRPAMIRERLEKALAVETIEVRDDSHHHAGHAGAQAGGGHYFVRIISPEFAEKNRLERHRLVYHAMGDAMRNDCIHALSIDALTPAEAANSSP